MKFTWSESKKRSSKESAGSFKSDGSKDYKIYLNEKCSFSIVRLMRSLSSGITSCLSVRRKDSQGCTADVKDTPPSPKEKRAKRCMKTFDSGVSSKRVWSKRGLIDFNESSLPRRVNFEKEHDVSDDEDWIKSPDDQRALRRTQSEPVKSDFQIPLRQQSPSHGGDEPGAVV